MAKSCQFMSLLQKNVCPDPVWKPATQGVSWRGARRGRAETERGLLCRGRARRAAPCPYAHESKGGGEGVPAGPCLPKAWRMRSSAPALPRAPRNASPRDCRSKEWEKSKTDPDRSNGIVADAVVSSWAVFPPPPRRLPVVPTARTSRGSWPGLPGKAGGSPDEALFKDPLSH
jgi:hypothetical protein